MSEYGHPKINKEVEHLTRWTVPADYSLSLKIVAVEIGDQNDMIRELLIEG